MGGVFESIDVGQMLGNPNLSPAAQGEIEDIMTPVLSAWTRELIQVWPVDTGTSLAGWQSAFVYPLWDLWNAIFYSEWVHASGERTLSHDILEAKARELVREALPAMRRVVQLDKRIEPGLGFGPRGDLGLGKPARLGLRPAAVAASRVDITAGIDRVQRRRERTRLRLFATAIQPLPADLPWLELLSADERALALSSRSRYTRAKQRAARARR